MILEVRLKNFFSIKDEIVLDLTPGNLRTQKAIDLKSNIFEHKGQEFLKTIAIYGANASGKSNVIKTIRFCCMMVLQSHAHNEGTTFAFKPFKFQDSKIPSEFYIRFIYNDIEYEYSFALTQSEIVKESLYHYPLGRKAKVFERDETLGTNKGEIYSFGAGVIKKPLDVAINTSKKTLYISRASQMDREIGKELFNFFNSQFILGYLERSVEDTISTFDKHKNLLISALRIADSDIIDVKYKKEKGLSVRVRVENGVPTTESNAREVEQVRFTTYHKADPSVPFDLLTEESDGTKKLFSILLTILDIIRNNKILLVDEIDTHLHPKIIDLIIKLFNTSRKSQIVFSTHNTKLLNLSKLRKDQIYFVYKNDNYSTDLHSLFDFKDFRDNMDVEKGYLQGRFDAIPFIDDSDYELKQLIDGEEG